MDRRFLAVLGAVVVILIAVFAFTQNSGNKSGTGQTSDQTKASNHIEGQGESGVKLVEYGDYQCPICAEYYKVVNQVASKFSKEIYFQYRNLPLTQIHPNSFASARAAEAADMQGKFWQMHDLLYKNQDQWSGASDALSVFGGYAKQLGLDVNKFNSDYASEQVNNTINADVAAFNKTGQQMATPTFFLDGKYLDNGKLIDPQTGQPSVDKFSSVIQDEIAAKQKS